MAYLASHWWQFEGYMMCLEFGPVSHNKGLLGGIMPPLYLGHTVLGQNKILMKWC